MAGDWLKVECATPDKAEVLALSAKMGWDDPDMAVGKLFRMWRWFDQHTVGGNAVGVTAALLDRICGVIGFSEAVKSVGWLEITESGISLPGFDKHCGETAKQRAQTAKRVASHKTNAKGNAAGNANTNATGNGVSVTSALPREEKRREEKKKRKNTSPTCVGAARFEEFWTEYPRHENKKKTLAVWQSKNLEAQADFIIADVRKRKAQHRPWREGFILYAERYLRDERWTDEIDSQAPRVAAANKPLPDDDDLGDHGFDWRRAG